MALEPSLLQRFATLRECLHWTCLDDRRGLKAIAADCDLSVSELSRRLSPAEGDPRSCDVNLMVAVMESTKDLTPLHWLMARFLSDDASRTAAALQTVESVLPALLSAVAELKGAAVTRGGRR
jgi:hypothetical protein